MSRDNTKTPGRLNIAALLDHLNVFGRGYEGQLREALRMRCNDRGHNLLLLYGGALEAPTLTGGAGNAIYRMLRPGDFDGIIVASGLLSTYGGDRAVEQLVEPYKPTRMCSVGTAIPGVPSLILDNRVGIVAATEHLIREHGCRRLAFVAGTPKNPEAEDRFRAFRGVLDSYRLPFDPALTASGQFLPSFGRSAMDQILDRGVPFDAVVAANDSMAIGAIQAMRKRGIRIPQDIPITGFDDLTLARLANPPLTTVSQPFEMLADLAVGCIEDQAAGLPTRAVTEIPSQFIIRQSCGCGYRKLTHVDPRPDLSAEENLGRLLERIEAIRPVLAEVLKTGADDGGFAATQLTEALIAEISGESEAFHRAVGSLLVDIDDNNERQRTLQSAISRLRNELVGDVDARIERTFFDGLSLVANSTTAAQVQIRLELDENGEQTSAAFDVRSLRDSLVRALPAAGVHSAMLSCIPEGTSSELEPVLCLVADVPHDTGVARFPASKLIPPEVLEWLRPTTFLVFPLVDEQELLGVIAFDHHDGNNAYIVFRNQIAAVLKNIRLHQEVLRKTMLHERSVQERLATTKRMEALSVLAGGVAHDLNNALGPLMVIPEVIADQISRLRIDESAVAELRTDIESIKTATLRAAQTIKDLLTLGRQGRTPKTDVDLNRLVKSCMIDGPWTTQHDHRKVNLRLDLASEPLGLRAAETQLARAVSNLVRNAVEAIEAVGEVVVRTARVHLANPTTGFESIPPGWYAVLSVADTGCGIPAEELGRVFEPFFTKKRASENSGTGLGLAIVHGVVKENDGFLDVISAPGVGTTFSLYFPISAASQPRAAKPSLLPRGQARILVIDDEQIQLRTCRRVLTRLGYTVETSASGQLACEMFRQAASGKQSPFDLILVDMLLGETLDGLEVIEQIHTLFPAQKAIIVSGHAPNERAEAAIQRGLSWLAKPYDVETLAHAVADTIGTQSARSSLG